MIVSLTAQTEPAHASPVAPGIITTFTLVVQHNGGIDRLSRVEVQLVEGSFPDPDTISLQRTVVVEQSCAITPQTPATVEGIVLCPVTIPQSVANFMGPFTFIVTLIDDEGEIERAVFP